MENLRKNKGKYNARLLALRVVFTCFLWTEICIVAIAADRGGIPAMLLCALAAGIMAVKVENLIFEK